MNRINLYVFSQIVKSCTLVFFIFVAIAWLMQLSRLFTIMNNLQIDFLDIDVEAADLDVLKSLDFSRYSPKLICVEIYPENMDFNNINNINIEKSDIYNLLKIKNYQKIWSGIFNHIFVRNF